MLKQMLEGRGRVPGHLLTWGVCGQVPLSRDSEDEQR